MRAYNWALKFDAAYELPVDEAQHDLRAWVRGAVRSRLQPIIDFAHLVEGHWLGVIRWFESRVSNGLLKGLNSLVQAAKRRARGYRSTRNYIAMIYLNRRQAQTRPTHVKQRGASNSGPTEVLPVPSTAGGLPERPPGLVVHLA